MVRGTTVRNMAGIKAVSTGTPIYDLYRAPVWEPFSQHYRFADIHPYTCGICKWGRDGFYHDEAEYAKHMNEEHC